MPKVGSKKNYGWGNKIKYACFNSLRDEYSQRFSTMDTYKSRVEQFASWCKENSINNAEKIDNETLREYAEHLKEFVFSGEMSVATAQNYVSAANVVMSCLRGDEKVHISPSKHLGSRSFIRFEEPSGDRASLRETMERMHDLGNHGSAHAVNLAREGGLRMKESLLLNIRDSLREAESTGRVNVILGTKGGRNRTVIATEKFIFALRNASKYVGSRQSNLIDPGKSFKEMYQKTYKSWVQCKSNGLKNMHDLRAAWACERYEQLSGYKAPVITGKREAPKDIHYAACVILAQELGHGRVDVLTNYIGSHA